MPRHQRSRRNGFSIMEVVIAGGIMSILMVAMAAMLTNQAKQNRSITLVSEFNGMVNELRAVLMDQAACNSVFAGMAMKNGDIELKSPAPAIKRDAKYGSLDIQTIVFEGAAPVCAPPCNRRRATIHITTRMPGMYGGHIQNKIPVKESKMSLIAEVSLPASASPIITKCLVPADSGSVDLEAFCISMGGTFDTATSSCTLPPPPSPPPGLGLADVCTSMGGTYDNTTNRCTLPGPSPTPSPSPSPSPSPTLTLAEVCSSLNGSFNSTSKKCHLPVEVQTGLVHDGDNYPAVPSGYTREDCKLFIIGEDMHHGNQAKARNGGPAPGTLPPDTDHPSHRDKIGDDDMWGDNHYGGTQAYLDANENKIRCRYWLTLGASAHKDGRDDPVDFYGGDPVRWPASCRYLMICQK